MLKPYTRTDVLAKKTPAILAILNLDPPNSFGIPDTQTVKSQEVRK